MTSKMITQDYFDEIVMETIETLELEHEHEVIKEVIEQLNCQEPTLSLDHISLTIPTSTRGIEIRAKRTALIESLRKIGTNEVVNLGELVRRIQELLVDPMLRTLFVVEGGVCKYCHLWREEGDKNIASVVIGTLLDLVQFKDAVNQIRDSMPLSVWLRNLDEEQSLEGDLIQLACETCRRSESQKTVFMGLEYSSQTLPQILLKVLARTENPGPVAQFCAILCTFDDPTSSQQASHANATALAQAGIIPAFISQISISTHKKTTIVCLISALRALAISNDNIQIMQDHGVVNLAITSFRNELTEDPPSADVLIPIVGLLRNLCAHDDVCALLFQDKDELVPQLQAISQLFSKNRPLQENICGTVQSMSLRKPMHAWSLVKEHQMHITVIYAMQQHPESATLQRVGACALRNLVCRTPELREALLDAGVKPVLLEAAKHLVAQDAVFAALRDLGQEVQWVDEKGKPVVQQFGQGHNRNFRPVY